jgi:hypothetical protein
MDKRCVGDGDRKKKDDPFIALVWYGMIWYGMVVLVWWYWYGGIVVWWWYGMEYGGITITKRTTKVL